MNNELKLLPPDDKMVLTKLDTFDDKMLMLRGFKNRQELTEKMFLLMKQHAGLGLSANQVGLPYKMFVMGGHPQIENAKSIAMFNPELVSESDEKVIMTEGCLTFPMIFLDVERSKECTFKYTDSEGKPQTADLTGMLARVALHEYDHMNGIQFTSKVSKFKLQRAKEKAEKEIKKIMRAQKNEKRT